MKFGRINMLARASAVAVLALQVPLVAKPGFGLLSKKKIELQVRRPALVRLANTSIAFRGSVTSQEYTPVVGSLEATLETELVGNEKSLVKKQNPGDADWVLDLKVTGFSTPPSKQRTESGSNSSTTYVQWTGSLNVAYQVIDKTGHVHDADNVTSAYDKEFNSVTSRTGILGGIGKGTSRSSEKAGDPHSTEDVKQILIRDVVQKIATNLGNTAQSLEVQVAGGDDHLDRSADFMSRRLWSRAQEELEKTPAFAKPEEEAYRLYNLGLSYEAMSYDGKTYKEQRANLFKAQEYYDKSVEMNRGEKYFIDVIARTRDSIARYRTLDAMASGDQKVVQAQSASSPVASPVTPAAAAPPPPTAPTAKSAKAMTLSDVIEMYGASVPQPQIVELIQSSPGDYDLLNKDAVLAITKAKLPVSLQNEMRKKAGLTLLEQAPAAPAKPAAPAAPKAAAPAPAKPAAPAAKLAAPAAK